MHHACLKYFISQNYFFAFRIKKLGVTELETALYPEVELYTVDLQKHVFLHFAVSVACL